MNYWLLVLILFLILSGLLSYFVRCRLIDPFGKRHPYPDRQDVKIRFNEPRVYVIVPNGSLTIYGNIKFFQVIVTPEEVWITAPRSLGFLSRALNANHRIRINSITEIKTFRRKTIRITYRHEDYTTRGIILRLRDIQGFMDALDHAGSGSYPA